MWLWTPAQWSVRLEEEGETEERPVPSPGVAEGQARLVSLCFTGVAVLCNLKAKPSTSRKMTTRFTSRRALSWQSGMEPAISLRCAYSFLSNPLRLAKVACPPTNRRPVPVKALADSEVSSLGLLLPTPSPPEP